ncbi:MAG TPA: carbonic anhydrase, partial [Cytophagaceae bacterium]
ASIQETLEGLPVNSEVIIDASNSKFIDFDVLDVIEEFKKQAQLKNIKVTVLNLKEAYTMPSKLLYSTRQSHSPEYEQLFVNNRKWVESMLVKDANYFENLAKGQSPKYLFIGCSDSRVPANEITQTDPGEMFVHRNIANLVVHTDMNVASVLQYSVEVLKVKHIIVCGHYGCGGIRAAVDGKDHGLIDKWLRNIKDVYRIHRKELENIFDEEERHKRLVELNVREQVYHLCMTAVVQNAMRDRGLKVHGWVYDIKQGYIKDLNIDLESEFKDFELYKFYEKLPVD